MINHPAFECLQPLLSRIDRANCLDSLNALARKMRIDISFVRAPEQKLSAVEYESRIVSHRELIVHDNLHDLFNACIWLTFPKTKRAISELHVALGAGDNNRRPRRRDVLTLFDESGLILLCEPTRCAEFATLNKTHQWKTLFVERRSEFVSHVRPLLFGHGALEQLASNPHRGLTAKALWLPIAASPSMSDVDCYLADRVIANELLTDTEQRIPMPLLGVPRWFAENENPACYDDVGVFRAARASTIKS